VIRLIWRNSTTIALIALLVVGAIIAQVASEQDQSKRPGPSLVSTDAGSNGTLALVLWLEQLGYRIDRPSSDGAAPTDTVRYYFVLRPVQRVSDDDARSIVEWVRRGGTLVYAPSLVTEGGVTPFAAGDGLDRRLDLIPAPLSFGEDRRTLAPSFPFFSAPTAPTFSVTPNVALHPTAADWLPLIEVDQSGRRQVLVARRRYGAGQAIAIGSDDFLANAHLGDAENSALVLNVLARGAEPRVAMFDEFHHGEELPPDLIVAARASPWGWTFTYVAVLCFGFAVWSGRRFGPPIVRERVLGRSSGDYVSAFAGLLQRGSVRSQANAWAQTHLNRLVRRTLARSQGVRPDLPAMDLAQLVASRRPVDPARLSEQLERLGGPPLKDTELLEVVRSLESTLGDAPSIPRPLSPTRVESGQP
jgi:hypothetical protein